MVVMEEQLIQLGIGSNTPVKNMLTVIIIIVMLLIILLFVVNFWNVAKRIRNSFSGYLLYYRIFCLVNCLKLKKSFFSSNFCVRPLVLR